MKDLDMKRRIQTTARAGKNSSLCRGIILASGGVRYTIFYNFLCMYVPWIEKPQACKLDAPVDGGSRHMPRTGLSWRKINPSLSLSSLGLRFHTPNT